MICANCQAIFRGDVPSFPKKIKLDKNMMPVDVGQVEGEMSFARPHHTDISEMCHAALNGCQICINLWRYFFKDKTPEQYIKNPIFLTGNMVHYYQGSGTYYTMLDPSIGGVVYSPETIEIEFGLNSPMERNAKGKRLICLPVRGMLLSYLS